MIRDMIKYWLLDMMLSYQICTYIYSIFCCCYLSDLPPLFDYCQGPQGNPGHQGHIGFPGPKVSVCLSAVLILVYEASIMTQSSY